MSDRYCRAVTAPMSYQCRCCGQTHDGLPFSYGATAPANWNDDLAGDPASELGEEHCIIAGQHFLVRARIVIPVTDASTEFDWGVWVSLSQTNFERMSALWTVD